MRLHTDGDNWRGAEGRAPAPEPPGAPETERDVAGEYPLKHYRTRTYRFGPPEDTPCRQSPSLEAERSRVLNMAGISGRRVYLTTPAMARLAREQGRALRTDPHNHLEYYLDRANYADDELDDAMRLRMFESVMRMQEQLAAVRRLLTIAAALLAAGIAVGIIFGIIFLIR